jgi:hypothetical protein
MADKKISALTASSTPLAGTEVLPIVQGAATVKVSVANLTAGRSTSVSELISDDGVQGRWTVTQDSGGNKLFSTTPAFGGYRTGQIQANGTGANMVWGSDGNTTVGVGNLIVGTAAKGIDFSANTGAPGMTSELLDWYEEGNWTPTVSCLTSGTVTLSPSEGFYTKIGRLVHVSARFTVDSVASPNGIASIDGLPFVSANNNNASSAASLYLNGFGAGATPFVMGAIDLNSTSIYLFQFVAGSRVDTMANQFQAGARLYLSATYVAAV